MKETYDFKTKARIREELRKTIAELYTQPKQRSELKVLTLMSHEDNELRQIWGPLGFNPANITVVEEAAI